MLVSLYKNGNIVQVAPDGTVSPFYTVPPDQASRYNDENYMAVARSGNLGGFTPGDVFTGDGLVVRITDGGRTAEPFATLPGEYGLFRGDLIVATTSGAVWLVNAQGQATHLADAGAFLEGATVIPDDPSRYGPLAGTIAVTEELGNAIDAIGYDDQGALFVHHYAIGVNTPETLMVVPPNENFYGVNATNTVYGAPASEFTSLVGEILVVSEYPEARPDGTHESGIYRLCWEPDTNSFKTEQIVLNPESTDSSHWEHVNFSPAALGPIKNSWPGLPDWTVYADLNHNGRLDQGEPSTTTAADGSYALAVNPGTYAVREVPQTGWTQTNPSLQPPTAGAYQITLTANGQVAAGHDFLNEENDPLGVDNPPHFTTTPNTAATVGARYRYASHATDPDFDALTYALPVHPDGMVVNATTGVVYWTPTASQKGGQAITERVRDGRGEVDLKTFTVAVSGANLLPYFGTKPKPTAYAGSVYRYQAHAQDADGDPVSYSISPQSPGLTFNTATGLLTWAVPATPGTYQWTIMTDDGRNGTASQTVSVAVTYDPNNHPPVITSTPRTTLQAGRTYEYQVQAKDPDGDALNYVLDSGPAGMAISPTGLVGWIPDLNANPVPAASFVGADTTSPGQWSGVYGRGGYLVSQGASTDRSKLPPWVKATVSGQTGVTWAANTSDPRAVQPAPGAGGWDAGGWSDPTLTLDVNVLDGQSHAVALYAVDWDTSNARSERVDVVNATTGAVLDSRTLQDFSGGAYLSWNVAGHVQLKITGLAGPGAVASGLFVGGTPVSLHVEDGRGGSSPEQSYQILLSSQNTNQPPVIDTKPSGGAVADEPYAVAFQGEDPDGDPITWSLDHPSGDLGGMTVTADGLLLWKPTTDQIGPHTVTVSADDGARGVTHLTFRVTVRGTDVPPRFTATPPTLAAVGVPYSYAVAVDDPEGETLTYALPAHPDGMSIDPATGAITWDSPSTAGADAHGDFTVTVTASDAEGDGAGQTYQVHVSTDSNRPPTITSKPVTGGNTAAVYKYVVTATDPDNDPVSFSLASGLPSWLAFDPNQPGLLESVTTSNNNTPTPPMPGTSDVTVIATDPSGATDNQTFALTVKQDSGPTVSSIGGPFTLLAGTPFLRRVNVSDLDGDVLTYVLDDYPDWMSVDDQGLLSGTPPANLATTTYANVKVVAVDSSGVESPPVYFDLTVNADTEAPYPTLTMDVNPADHTVLPGTTVHFTASATDNQHVQSLSLYVDGKPVTLVGSGAVSTASHVFQNLGKHRSCLFSHGLPGERCYVSVGRVGSALGLWSSASSCWKMDRPVSHQRVTSDRRLSSVNRSKRVASEASTVRITPRRWAPSAVLLVRAPLRTSASRRAFRSLRLLVASTVGCSTNTNRQSGLSINSFCKRMKSARCGGVSSATIRSP